MGFEGVYISRTCFHDVCDFSGESGAGKTESTKLIIKQLIELCRGNTQLEQQILQVQCSCNVNSSFPGFSHSLDKILDKLQELTKAIIQYQWYNELTMQTGKQ